MLALAVAGAARATPALTAEHVRLVCATDLQKYCPDAKPGAGTVRACIRAHFMRFTKPCRHALLTFRDDREGRSDVAAAPSP